MIKAVQVRMTKDQWNRLRAYAEMRGFPSLASYIRYVALDQDFVLRRKILEIHRHLLGDQEESKKRKRKGQRRHLVEIR